MSFKNIKFIKQPSIENKQTKQGEISSSKEFEDRATAILQEMRKQRRTLQMEYVAKVTLPTPKTGSGWRDKLSHEEKENEREVGVSSTQSKIGSYQKTISKREPEITKIKSGQKRETSVNENQKPKEELKVMTKITSPLDFILMKEEFIKKNPPPKKTHVEERLVESDSE